MTKPKTLKDLSSISVKHIDLTKRKVVGIDDDGDLVFDKPPETRIEKLKFVSHDDLRAEAKKWVKALNKPSREVTNLFGYNNEEIVVWIKHFYNLTGDEVEH